MFVVGYPRSGNTWLSYLLAYCLNNEYDDYDNPGVHPRDNHERKHVKGGLRHKSFQDRFKNVFKTHKLNLPDEDKHKIIYLVRDGRDVMVSYFFYLKAKEGRKGTATFEPETFSKFIMQYGPEWKQHINHWLGKNLTAIVRYEDLLILTKETLLSLFFRLKVKIDQQVIDGAIKIFSFNQLSQRPAGVEDRTSFYRKGIAGDWENFFSNSDLAYFHELSGELLRELGYLT